MKEVLLKAGTFFDRDVGEVAPTDRPEWIACRRTGDFKPGQIPADAKRDICASCGAAIIYNPAGPKFANNPPRVCMQCAGIEPLPI